MRILFISQLFDPEYSIKGLDLMKHWVDLGHEVEVITTYPNYPTGKVFDGYKVKLYDIEHIDGVKIIRLWSYISHSKSKISRASSYLSFTFMALASTLLTRKPDLIYAYHPQSTTGLIGIVMKCLQGVPFITDVQDLWPDALYATGLSEHNLAMKAIDKWCSLIYKQSSKIIVLSNGFKNALIERGVSEQKIEVVYNWCPEESRIEDTLSKSSESDKEKKKPASFIYAGNMGSAQSLESLIKAVSYFDESQLTLTLIGGGIEKEALTQYIKHNNINNVSVSNYIPPSEIFSKLNTADVLVVHLRNHPLFHITIPSKTQSSLAMRKPVLMVVGGESNEIIKQAEAGVIAEPGNVESIREAIETLLSNRDMWHEWGENGRNLYLKQFSIKNNYKRLSNVLKKVIN